MEGIEDHDKELGNLHNGSAAWGYDFGVGFMRMGTYTAWNGSEIFALEPGGQEYTQHGMD